MRSLLYGKIEILKEVARGLEIFDLETCRKMLDQSENSPESIEFLINSLEAKVCAKTVIDTHQNFYNKLGEINKKIENYKKSCIADL